MSLKLTPRDTSLAFKEIHTQYHVRHKTYQVHEEVQVDGQVRDEEGGRPSTGVVALHHHIRVAENEDGIR